VKKSEIFKYFKKRLWIPAQVWFEFLKNKDDVANKTVDLYYRLVTSVKSKNDGGYLDKIEKAAEELGKDELDEIKGQFKTFKENVSDNKKHPFLPNANFNEIEHSIEEIQNEIECFQKKVVNFKEVIRSQIASQIQILSTSVDQVKPSIEANFTVGKEYSFSEMIRICEKGAFRYLEKIPPGYMDENGKKGIQKYGDLFLWKQIMDKSKADHLDVLFVTNDVKEDWWDTELKSPRYELLKEFNSICNKLFWSCKFSDFLFYYDSITKSGSKEIFYAIEEAIAIEKDITEKKNESESDLLYKELVEKWISDKTDLKIIREIEKNSEWRVFGNYHIYLANDKIGNTNIIMLNILDTVCYSKVLHSFSNFTFAHDFA